MDVRVPSWAQFNRRFCGAKQFLGRARNDGETIRESKQSTGI